jgi:hypothetical protein
MGLDSVLRGSVASFVANDVQSMLVGGWALAAHGLRRYTGDLDPWITLSAENASNLLSALKDFGFEGLGLEPSDFLHDHRAIQLGFPPLRIDILTSIDRVLSDDAWQWRIVIAIDGLDLPFIGREDLLADKRAADRPQDIADIAPLTEDG